jgi:hypothetical protein
MRIFLALLVQAVLWLFAIVVGACGILLFYYLFGDAQSIWGVFAAFGFGALLVGLTTAFLMLIFRAIAPDAHRRFYQQHFQRRSR